MHAARKSWRMWGAVVVLLAATTEARAFYWFGWPGSQLRVEETLLTPPAQVPPAVVTPGVVTPPNTPPTFPPPGPTGRMPNPPIGPPVPVAKPPIGPPEQTPEPATGLLGLIGLGALAVRKWRKKKFAQRSELCG